MVHETERPIENSAHEHWPHRLCPERQRRDDIPAQAEGLGKRQPYSLRAEGPTQKPGLNQNFASVRRGWELHAQQQIPFGNDKQEMQEQRRRNDGIKVV
jgi:hypothetical protein